MHILKRVLIVCWLIVFGLASVIHAQEGETGDISWHPDGTYIAVSHDAQVDIVDATTLEIAGSFPTEDRYLGRVSWSPNGEWMANSNGPNAAIRPISISPISIGDPTFFELDTYPFALAWHPNSEMLAVSIANTDIRFWDTEGNQLPITFENVDPPARAHNFRWDAEGNQLAIARLDGDVEIWRLAQDSLTRQLLVYQPSYMDSHGYWNNPYSLSIDWSPGEDAFAFGTEQDIRIIYFADVAPNDTVISTEFESYVHYLEGHTGNVMSLDWHPTLNLIASGSDDGTVRIWDVDMREQIHVVNLGEGVYVNSVAWSPDGTHLAYGLPPASENLVEIIELDDILDMP